MANAKKQAPPPPQNRSKGEYTPATKDQPATYKPAPGERTDDQDQDFKRGGKVRKKKGKR